MPHSVGMYLPELKLIRRAIAAYHAALALVPLPARKSLFFLKYFSVERLSANVAADLSTDCHNGDVTRCGRAQLRPLLVPEPRHQTCRGSSFWADGDLRHASSTLQVPQPPQLACSPKFGIATLVNPA